MAVYGDPAHLQQAGPIILTICQISASKMPGESSRAHRLVTLGGEHLSRFFWYPMLQDELHMPRAAIARLFA